ncbi:MAG: amino acid adenylation domain-containing protein [Pseudomonadota bacterium]
MSTSETFLHEFVQRVTDAPGAPCLTESGSTFSRSQVLNKACTIADELRKAGVAKGDRVLVQLPRSTHLIATMLATVSIGAIYVPLEIRQPKKRREALIDLIQPAIMVTEPDDDQDTEPSVPRRVFVNSQFPPVEQTTRELDTEPAGEDIAYIICTSGSTGNPKGVQVPHTALLNYCEWAAREYRLADLDGACLSSGVSFDGTLLSQVAPLICGTPIVVAPEGEDLEVLANLLEPGSGWNGLINSSPSHLDAVAPLVSDDVDAARRCVIVVGGEAVTARSIGPWLQRFPNSTIVNEYGPTETTIACCFHKITHDDLSAERIPIGRPIDGVDVTIVSADLQPVDDGVHGEILVSGVGVAHGYLDMPDETANRFVRDPSSGKRAYRTGDLGYRDTDHEFQFLGRSDDQVKLRGFRIELEEVRRNLAEWSQADLSTVVLRETDKISQLVAFVRPKNPASRTVNTETMTAFLIDRLPDYMIPSRLVRIESLPITPAGKVDTKALLASLAGDVQQNTKATADEISSTLAEIWDGLLGCGTPRSDDNFFELGGNSVKATQLIALIKKQLGVALRPAQVFENYQFSSQIALIENPTNVGETSTQDTEKRGGSAIAIIGIGLNFPGARDWRGFWENLMAKEESITFFEHDELDPAVQAIANEPGYIKARGIIEDADCFDAGFFKMTPAEAALLDPQHRVFLETCWAALEDGGCAPNKAQNIGVYAGCGTDTYTIQNVVPNAIQNGDLVDLPTRLFNDKDYLTTRVSHKLNLTGPSINVNTACSTSLVAVTLAVKALRDGHCEMALAGGVSVDVPVNAGYRYVEGSMLSPDGHCRPFDSNAAGTVFNSGSGAVLLKPLEQAIEDGDQIYGTILGVGLNNDGADKSSFAAPSAVGQSKAIRAAFTDAGISPRDLDFVETHGTGTPIGDPIEVDGLLQAFGSEGEQTQYCAVGSVKSNFGHLVAAAGIAGLIKSVLSLKHGVYPATLHFDRPNPQIDFPNSPFFVAADHVPINVEDRPARCGVSSFGVGGTNAHVVLEAYKPEIGSGSTSDRVGPTPPFQILPFSANSKDSLEATIHEITEFARSNDNLLLSDLAYTLQQRRVTMDWRATVIADRLESIPEAVNSSSAFIKAPRDKLPIVFMFTGQGCQYPGMARELAAKNSVFAEAILDCLAVVNRFRDIDFEDLLLGEPTDDKAALLARTENAQPAIFTVEYSLFRALDAVGVKPDRLVGHSVGEFVAAVVAGVMTLEDALSAVCERGRLMGEQPSGTMLAVMAASAEVEAYLSDDVELAAHNAPNAHVLSGPTQAIADLIERLEADGIKHKPLNTSHAFHSRMMTPAVNPLISHLKSVTLRPAQVEIISTVTASAADSDMTDPTYWGQQVRQPVRFVDALNEAARHGKSLFVEVGPGAQLTTLARMSLAADEHVIVPACSRANEGEEYGFADAVGQLWKNGVDIDWPALESDHAEFVSLPTYAFARKRHWIEAPSTNDPLVRSRQAPGVGVTSESVKSVIENQIKVMETQLDLISKRKPQRS